MRERISIAMTVGAMVLLVALSLAFARIQNPGAGAVAVAEAPVADDVVPTVPEPPPTDPAVPAPMADVPGDSARGREVFRALGCERCHSVAGTGSPRYPLDGVGARRSSAELLAWTVAEPAVRDSLSPSAVRAKRRYEDVPQADMDALVRYMASLRSPD